MTEIRYDRNDMRMTIRGHAEGGKAGEDVVCAGISALTQTLVRALRDMQTEKDGKLEYKLDKPGEMEIHFIPVPWVRITSGHLFDFVALGLRTIAENYPENARIEEV